MSIDLLTRVCKAKITRLFWTLLTLFHFAPLEAQTPAQNMIKGAIIGGALILAAKNARKNSPAGKAAAANNAAAKNSQAADTAQVFAFNNRPLSAYTPATLRDIGGNWEGELTDGNTIWYDEICLVKIGENTWSGIDSFYLERKKDGSAIQNPAPHVRQTFLATLDNNAVLAFSNVENVANPNWGLIEEHLKFVMDRDSAVLINNNDQQHPARKIYLRRTGRTVPGELAQYLITKNALEITAITYKNSKNGSVLEYNDHGQMTISLKNKIGKDLKDLQLKTELSAGNGLVNTNLGGSVNMAKNSVNSFSGPIVSNFSVPHDSVRFTVTFTYNGIELARRSMALATDPFFKTTGLTLPAYTSPRLEAVAGYYGWDNTPYADVSKPLEPLVTGGDKMAAMWKAIFLSLGHGGYKIDEDQGYAIGKTCVRSIEDKARHGDAEATYLMFYACQFGLEGDDAKALSVNFLQSAAAAGFKPAVYDYAVVFNWHKEYGSALTTLFQSYAAGVKKAAEVIGNMYEKGLAAPNDIDSAIYWYKAGMAFGDPDAILCYANLVAKGYNDVPPDVNKALALSTSAAAKNNTDAMIFNGSLYFDGKQGIEKNVPAAIRWYKAGAELGDRQAMLALGEAYIAGGPGVPKDERSGLFWIKRAAESGSPKAMLVLAAFYNEGTVAEKSVIAARFWYNQAVLNGYAKQDATGLNAGAENFMNFWKYADFSPSYVYVNEYGDQVGDAGDGMMNGLFSGLMGSMFSYYGNHQQLIDGLEYIHKKNGYKIYGGTVSSHFISNLYLKEGQTVSIRSYGIVSTGMMSGPATADGLGNAWAEYRIIKNIPCSAVMAAIKDGNNWKLIGQNGSYTAATGGALVFALNAIDYANYKGYFDIVVWVPEN